VQQLCKLLQHFLGERKAVVTTGGSAAALLRDLVDLVGIEPTTSSMPWKRAPSCATGPLLGDTTGDPLRTALSILAECTQIVNARDLPENCAWGDPSRG
jgi:hypothetical protein